MALESVQPVPWVLGLSIRRPRNQRVSPSGRQSRSFASFIWWPPLQRTAQPYSALIFLAAASMSSAPFISRPESISASGMLGVTTSARGRSAALSVPMASSRRSFAPLVATMTGSTTTCRAPYSRSFAAMSSMSPAEETMPTFTASGLMSVNTASSSAAKNSGVASRMSVTPVVFWAVRAVTALIAKTPFMVMVLMSAWIPAPPLESLPAIVNAVLIINPSFPALLLYSGARWCPQCAAFY